MTYQPDQDTPERQTPRSPLRNEAEIKLTLRSISLRVLIFYLLSLYAGTLLYVFIWEEFSAYGFGYGFGTLWVKGAVWKLLVSGGGYLLLEFLVIYVINGYRLQGIGWHWDLKGIGAYLHHPVPLRLYRLRLLLPGLLMGLLPLVHGFCTGNGHVYAVGLLALTAATADFRIWFKLRPYDDDDLFREGKKSYEGTVIRRNYGKRR